MILLSLSYFKFPALSQSSFVLCRHVHALIDRETDWSQNIPISNKIDNPDGVMIEVALNC